MYSIEVKPTQKSDTGVLCKIIIYYSVQLNVEHFYFNFKTNSLFNFNYDVLHS